MIAQTVLAGLIGFILGFMVVVSQDAVCIIREDSETGVATVMYNKKLYRLIKFEERGEVSE